MTLDEGLLFGTVIVLALAGVAFLLWMFDKDPEETELINQKADEVD